MKDPLGARGVMEIYGVGDQLVRTIKGEDQVRDSRTSTVVASRLSAKLDARPALSFAELPLELLLRQLGGPRFTVGNWMQRD